MVEDQRNRYRICYLDNAIFYSSQMTHNYVFQAMENVTKMLKLMLKKGLLTDDPASSELSTDIDTDENQTENILKEKKSKTLKSIKSSKSENSYFPALAKFICENLEVSEFENNKAMDPRTVIG